MKKKICVITGSRSEYGLLKNLLSEIKKSNKLDLQLVVTGSHLSTNFGYTVREIQSDKFKINKTIKILKKNDNLKNLPKTMSIALSKFTETFVNLKPDLLLILGDRYEILASAISALFLKIPIAHLHGGERSEGAYDESIRHSVTKFSHLHFVSTKIYKKRVIQLGENKKNVHVTGSMGVDSIKKIKFLNKKKLEKKHKINFSKKNFFIIFHPVTLEDNTQKSNMLQILKAMDQFPEYGKFFVYPGADFGGNTIIKLIDNYVKKNKYCFKFKSLNQRDYFSFVKNCDVVLGNSSSGVIEVPSLKVGVINIGDRQKGRIKSNAILDSKPLCKDIVKNIKKISSWEYLFKIKHVKNPYDHPNCLKKIIKVLEKKISLNKLIKKKFYDL